MNEVSSIGVPQFASSIIAASDELVSILVEAAVGKGEDVTLQFLDKHEFLLSLFFDFLNKFCVCSGVLLMMVFI